MDATFSGSNIFTVANDRTAEFVTGRRIKADCVGDGYVYASVVSSSYIDPNTVVVIDEDELTSNLIAVLYGVVEPGAVGSLPDHAHDESEGSGGEITVSEIDGGDVAAFPEVFNSASTGYISSVMLDSTHVLVSYRDYGGSSAGTSIVGTISGTSISWGGESVFNSGNTSYTSSVMLDSTHVMISYKDEGNSNYGTSIVGTISNGDEIAWGSEYVFNNSGTTDFISSAMIDSTHVMVSYRDAGNSNYGTSIVGTIDGDVITFGDESVFNSGQTDFTSSAMIDSTHVLVSYMDAGNSYYGTSIVGTISGTSITFPGSEYVFNSENTTYTSSVMLDSTHVMISYRDGGNSNYGTSIIGTIDGTSISWGSEYVFNSGDTLDISSAMLDSTHVLVSYRDAGNSNYGTSIVGTINGTSITWGSENVFNSATTSYTSSVMIDSAHAMVSYRDGGNSNYGTSMVLYSITMATRIQLRRDTAANWTSANPILASGEPGYETDTVKYKIGDGVTAWSGLDYFSRVHSDIGNLDYASAGHTGFQPSGDYATNTDLATVSGLTDTNAADIATNAGDISTNAGAISDNTALITTTSGAIVAQIITDLAGLTDGPSGYDEGKYLQSTVGGWEWITVSEIDTIDGGNATSFPSPTAKLWGWGDNGWGQLGQGDTTNRSSPIQTGVLEDWVWDGGVVSGDTHTLAVKIDGTLWTCGRNNNGQLGHGDIIHRSAPTQVGLLDDWSKAAGGFYHALAVKTDGTLWSWGDNFVGELGLGDQTKRSSPTQVGLDENWSKAACGNSYHSHAIKTDGTLWVWGANNFGQLGQGHTSHRSSPVQVGDLADWSSVDAGAGSIAAIKTDGTLWTWGYNNYGQLGLGHTSPDRYSSPVQVGGLSNWSQVSCGHYSHVLATKTDGTLWGWGYNNWGQLGLGHITTPINSPVQVGLLDDWSSVSAGYYHTAATRTGGTLWTWGIGNYGQLGHGDTANYSSPVQVGVLTTWNGVDCGANYTLGLE